MKYSPKLIKGRLIKRYKRFLADVELENGEEITVHTANTGKMTGCAEPGAEVWLRDSQNTKRKYPYTWELSSTVQTDKAPSVTPTFIGINTQLANALCLEAIRENKITELVGYDEFLSEISYGKASDGKKRSRIDLLLKAKNKADCYIEIKNVTLSLGNGLGAFPDAVSLRALKHLDELLYMHQQGARSVLLFCVPREDIECVTPAQHIHPEYAKRLREVWEQGVEILAYGCRLSPEEIYLNKALALSWPKAN